MAKPGKPLNRERIVAAAVAVADRTGLNGVSMRTVGRELGVEAMSLYHHVTSKDEVVDQLADWVFTEIPAPAPTDPWRTAMTANGSAARIALQRHPWALGLIESRRNPGPALLGHHDAVLGCLRANGFSVELAVHAFSVTDAYVFGFVLSELSLPMEPGESAEAFTEQAGLPTANYPHLAEVIATQVVSQEYAYGDEFGYGLELILDGIEDRLKRTGG